MPRSLPAVLAIAVIACVLAPSAQALPAREIAGVTVHPWRMQEAGEVESTFADLAALGVRWARVDLRWNRVEAGGPAVAAGGGNWAEMDRIVAAAARHEIRLLPIVGFTPSWASASGETWALPDTAPFADYFAAVLRRYPRIPAWELWNEPNYSAFAKPFPDPAGFVEFLRTAHRVRAQVGSTAKLISGGLAPGTEIDIIPWVKEMSRLGGLELIDGLGVHPYSSAAPNTRGAWMMRLEDLHNGLAFVGHGDLKLWLTEYGAPVSSVATGWGPAALTEEQQAEWLRLAFATATQLPFVENLTWFEYRDSCVDPSTAACRFGLLRGDRSPRAAYSALREVVAETTRFQPQLTLSLSSRGARARIVEPIPARDSSVVRARSATRRSQYVYLQGLLALPASPSADTPMTLRLLRRGAAPKTMSLLVRNGAFRVRLGRVDGRLRKVEAYYGGSSVYAPVAASLRPNYGSSGSPLSQALRAPVSSHRTGKKDSSRDRSPRRR